MSSSRPPTIFEHCVNTLRDGIRTRLWAGALPGVQPLAKQIGVSVATIHRALKQLEKEGLIETQGAGRRRSVRAQDAPTTERRVLRIGILLDETFSEQPPQEQIFLHDIQHELEAAGHKPFLARTTLRAMRDNHKVIRAMMQESEADLWIVHCASRELLKKLSVDFPHTLLALGGRFFDLEISGTSIDLTNAMRETVQHLTSLGHERIVLAFPPFTRIPQPTASVQAFMDALAAAGISPSAYHLPDWELSADGYEKLLQSLFAVTPPTALILDDTRQYMATLSFLATQGISPRNLSLVVFVTDTTLSWAKPRPCYFQYEYASMIRDILDWIEKRVVGCNSHIKHLHNAKLVAGDLLGPPSPANAISLNKGILKKKI